MFFLLKLLNGIGGLNVYVYRQSVSPISTWAFVGPCRRCWKEITVRRPLAGGFPCFVCVGLLLEPLKRIAFWSRCEDVNSHVQSQRSVTKLCGTEIGEKNRHDINQKRLVTFSTRNRKRLVKLRVETVTTPTESFVNLNCFSICLLMVSHLRKN